MTDHTRHYDRDQLVLVEGRVVSYETGRPFGAVTVRFAEGTDPSFLLDGVDVVLPQALVHTLPDARVAVPSDYESEEGWYGDDEFTD